MAMYDWREFDEGILQERLPRRDDIVGIEAWQYFLMLLRDFLGIAEPPEGFDRISGAFNQFLDATNSLPRRTVSRVFVSHQRNDATWAERLAWQATEVGFEYWLDIHDP